MRTPRELDASETVPVQAANLTAGCTHGPTELARVVAADNDWLFAYTDQLVDQNHVVIASTIGDAGEAMDALGWFSGDDDGETWIVWGQVPDTSEARADAVRAWLQEHRPELMATDDD